ncbi:MAG: hypothetical protein COB09_10995 [Thalassobium sp.]|nr:MAG: hypothetical protein COB09_10995 [Thalassobium sp.]
MILERDGKTTEIKLKDLSTSLKLPIKTQDASGNSSATTKLNTGTKAKQISVSGRIGFKYAGDLTELIKLAEALEDDGSRAVYTIVDETADAADITRVIFDGDLDARKVPDLLAWAVTFSFSEYLSTAERAEAIRKAGAAAVVTDSISGEEVSGSSESDSAIDKDGFVYKALQKVEGFLSGFDS